MTPMITRAVSVLPPGIPFVRFLRGLKFGPEYAQQFRDSPQVEAALHARVTKGAVGGLVSGDAPDLAQFGIYDPATAQLLSGQSAFEACRGKMRVLPFNV